MGSQEPVVPGPAFAGLNSSGDSTSQHRWGYSIPAFAGMTPEDGRRSETVSSSPESALAIAQFGAGVRGQQIEDHGRRERHGADGKIAERHVAGIDDGAVVPDQA